MSPNFDQNVLLYQIIITVLEVFLNSRQWRTLDGEQLKYLIQISPPADIIQEVIRSIIIAQNITDAGILFDDSFGKSHSKCEY